MPRAWAHWSLVLGHCLKIWRLVLHAFSARVLRVRGPCSDPTRSVTSCPGHLIAHVPNANRCVIARGNENLVAALQRRDASRVAPQRADFLPRGYVPQPNLVVA